VYIWAICHIKLWILRLIIEYADDQNRMIVLNFICFLI
jgi:hypothetical protein